MRCLSRSFVAVSFVIMLAAIVGCGHSANPAAPADPSAPPSSGATISGMVLGGSSSSAVRTASTTGSSMTVTVVGTNITVTVSPNGQFTITGVPGGDITLRFHGAGGDANVQITQVVVGETITITITIQGTTATTQTLTRTSGSNEQVEGRIDSIDTTAQTFVVAGKTITTDSSTTYTHGSETYAFGDLQVGWRVHVAGTATTGGVLASRVEVQNTNGAIQVTLNGTVQGFTGTATAFEFTVNGTLVKGDAVTAFYGNSTFAALANGVRVEVKGQQKDGYVYATRIHAN